MERTMYKPVVARQRRIPNLWGMGGASAGLMGGAMMVILSPILSWLTGGDMWAPPLYAALLEPGQLGFGGHAVVVATLLHFGVSGAIGILFGVVYHRVLRLTTDFGLPLYFGLAYGLLNFFVAYWIVFPAIGSTVIEAGEGMGTLLVQHLVFAVCLGGWYGWLCPRPYVEH